MIFNYLDTNTLQLNFSLCQRGVCPAVDPPSQLCPCISRRSSSTEPSPKGQVWGVKFNLKPDSEGDRGEGLGSLLCAILLCISLYVCIYQSAALSVCLWSCGFGDLFSCGQDQVHWGKTADLLSSDGAMYVFFFLTFKSRKLHLIRWKSEQKPILILPAIYNTTLLSCFSGSDL